MSIKIHTAQKSRPYKVEVFGLQDDFIGTLQSFDDLSIGRVQNAKVSLSTDGTQEFTCSIPRYYINPETNEKIINPRWEDIKKGVLAENTRVLKVFVIEQGETKVYPFIVDKIIDKRDAHFSVYKEITASGLAFAELGKVGLRLELNSHVVETDYKKDTNTVAVIDYWLDKVFPNEKDDEGNIIRWLTPWSYDIRMDWRHYSNAEQRDSRKMYDDVSIDKWDTVDGKLTPVGQTELIEKARYVSSDRGSNKYNITQTIAETFGLFCSYEYKCAANGQFIKNYIDENGRPMTGRTAVFYNRAVKTDKPFYMDYQKNLQSISRTCDTSEVYTKLFVDPIQSETMTDGYITIANTPANPLMDEFILNFDYLYSKGSITEYQKNFVDEYSVELHDKNTVLRDLGDYINLLTVELNDKKAEKAGAEKSISSLTEELTHYQTLRDNDVTNTPVIKDKNNSYSVVFVNVSDTEVPYYRAEIRLEGVLSGSINGYDTYEYKDLIFAASNLVSSNDYKPLAEGDTNMYVVLDEDGYAKGLYTSNADWFKTEEDENSYSLNASYIIYLALEYSPHNKYVEVCERFGRMIAKNRECVATCETEIKHLETIFDGQLEQQTILLKEKDLLNQKFERIMGPALREGHWSAQDYEDIGRKTEVELAAKPLPNNIELGSEILTFDAELFEDEEKGYYYASAEDASNDIHTYHDYINIADYINDWQNKNPEDLVLHFANPEFKYTVTESQYEGLAAGKYFIIYNMTKYYFELSEALNAGASLRLYVSPKTGLSLQQKVNETAEWDDIEWLEPPTSEEELYYSNLSNAFEGLNKYLGTYKIYPNAGFVYAFKYNEGELPTPILLLNSTEINYSIYKQIWYSFGTDEPAEIDLYPKKTSNGKFIICYPRIIITKDNVNYDDDLLSIKPTNAEKALVKYEDYAVLLRNGHPYITLKVTDHTTPYALLKTPHTIIYRTSQANEMLYRDAVEVARENSRPRFSYDVQITQIPETVESYELGQLGYINDNALGVNAAKGYISQITLVLDNPKDDEIQIQNYKTKFEDLFSTITASSETIKSNQQSYDIAASIINPSTGGIQGSILQDSFNKNKVELTYSNTQVHIDDTDGITLTNSEPYSNGVYGQVVMRGGGIYLSNTVDNNYERVWSTGITPNGINASMITTGQLDANLVRILAGNNVAFQWNSEGIYAYKRDENNQFLPNTYVRYSDKGLQYIDNGNTMVDLGWGGLVVNSQDGSVSLTGKDGLVVYEGLPNQNKTNQVVKLGRFGEEGNYTYGLKLYKSENGNYVETLTTENNGQLWLKDYLTVGAEGAGISGVNDNSNPVRFWAGSDFTNRSAAPFRVLHDGSVYASKLVIGGNTGDMTASELIDQVGGLQDSVDNLGTQAAQLSIRTISTAGQIYNSSEENSVTTLFTEIYLGEIRLTGNQLDERGYESRKLTYYRKGLSDTEWMSYSIPTEDINGAYQTTNVKMEVGVQYKAELTYIYHGFSYEATSAPIAFTMVSNGDGLSGQDGVGISEVIEYYYTNNIEVAPAPKEEGFNELGVQYEEDSITVKAISKNVWTSVLTNPDASNKFLWNVEETHYSNGDNISYITYTQPALIARYTENGAEGKPGRGIKSITEYYMVTSKDSGVVAETNVDDGSWTTAIQSVSSTKRYLWNYEIITYDAANATGSYKQTTKACIIGVYGDKGDTGDNGRSIKEIKEQYAISDNKTTAPTNWGGLTNPTSDAPYLWAKETITYDKGMPLTEEFTRIIATYAPPGENGTNGRGIEGIVNYYKKTSSTTVPAFSKDNPTSNSWQTSLVATDTTNKYLWNVELVTWKEANGSTTTTNTAPRIISTHGATGSAGSNAINYRLQLSATSVTKKLNGSFSPTTVTCSVNKIADTTTSNIDISNFKLKVQKQVGNNKTEISTMQSSNNWVMALNSTMTDAESFILTLTDSNGTVIYDTCSISCVISDELKELAAIDGNEVYINEGKVRASSIAAYAITAGKIAAGAIETGGIAAGSELYLYTAGENQVLTSLPTYGSSWRDPESGASIMINSVEAYNSAIHSALNYNYNLSTGGKMKLSSGGVEIKATNSSKDLEGNDISVENGISIDKTAVIIGAKDLTNSSEGEEKYLSRLIINSDGIDATSASFNSITLNGKAIFGGAEVVVQSSEPTERRGPTVWIRPNWNVYADVSKTLTAVSTITQKDLAKELLLDFIGPGISEESNIETVYELTITTNIIHQSGFSYIINADNKLVVEFYSDEDATTPFVSFKQACPITEATKWKTTTYTLTGTSAYNIFRDEYINRSIVMKYYSEGGDTNNQFRLAEGYEIKLVGKLAATTEGSGRALCSIWYFDS